jgi:ADP-heptose:LPS heptosyltransferase
MSQWAAFTQTLLQKRPELWVVATAGPKAREQERLRALREAVNHPRLLCFDSLSIARLSALLERCQLHVGADSGALQLAMALGVPTLGIFRQHDGLNEWLPRGASHRSLIGPSLDAISSDAMLEAALGMVREGG